jgi:anti-sigma B factor antagonist
MPDDRDQLSIVLERHGHRVLVRLRGELDIVTAPAFADALNQTNSEIVVDFADLAFVDASGLGVLAHASERAEQDGDQLIVVNAGPLAQRMFTVSGLDHLLAGTDAPQ